MKDLRTRMESYERVYDNIVVSETPLLIRVDGRAFHTFTKGFDKPFDRIFTETMQETMKYLCENIGNTVLGYTQSDEITIVVYAYHTDDWFSNRLEKIVSLSAAMATFQFNKIFKEKVDSVLEDIDESTSKRAKAYRKAIETGGLFDARVMTVPLEDVNNALIYRQSDAVRNSISTLAQSIYKQSELKGVNKNQLQDKMFTEHGVNWNNYPTEVKRGSCCIKVPVEVANGVIRNKWVIDREIPTFSVDRDYVNSRLKAKQEEADKKKR